MKKAWKETFMQGVFFIAACASVLAVALICLFLFANGIPAMREIGLLNFLSGEKWKPSNEIFGIFPMIIGSIYVTAGAIMIGVPIGIFTSIFLAKYCPPKNLSGVEGCNRTFGRDSIGGIWIFRDCGAGTSCTGR